MTENNSTGVLKYYTAVQKSLVIDLAISYGIKQ